MLIVPKLSVAGDTGKRVYESTFNRLACTKHRRRTCIFQVLCRTGFYTRWPLEVAKADLTTSRQIVADKTKELNAIVQRLDKVIADRAAMGE